MMAWLATWLLQPRRDGPLALRPASASAQGLPPQGSGPAGGGGDGAEEEERRAGSRMEAAALVAAAAVAARPGARAGLCALCWGEIKGTATAAA